MSFLCDVCCSDNTSDQALASGVQVLPDQPPGAQWVERASEKSGNKYVGYMVNGKREGFGKYTIGKDTGYYYEGQWKEDKAHGKGTLKEKETEYTGIGWFLTF